VFRLFFTASIQFSSIQLKKIIKEINVICHGKTKYSIVIINFLVVISHSHLSYHIPHPKQWAKRDKETKVGVLREGMIQ
jgi:hypothetical protein